MSRRVDPELTDAQLDAVSTYIRALAPPARRNLEDARVKDGEALFHEIGCADCHREALHVTNFPLQPALNGVEIGPALYRGPRSLRWRSGKR